MLLRMSPIFEILLYRTGNRAMAPAHLCPQHTRLLNQIIFIISPALLLSLTNRNYNLWYFFNSSQSLLTLGTRLRSVPGGPESPITDGRSTEIGFVWEVPGLTGFPFGNERSPHSEQ